MTKNHSVFLPILLVLVAGWSVAKSSREFKASQARQYTYMLELQEVAGTGKEYHKCNCESNDPRSEETPENPWYYANRYLWYYSLPPYHGYWNYGSQFARLKRY